MSIMDGFSPESDSLRMYLDLSVVQVYVAACGGGGQGEWWNRGRRKVFARKTNICRLQWPSVLMSKQVPNGFSFMSSLLMISSFISRRDKGRFLTDSSDFC